MIKNLFKRIALKITSSRFIVTAWSMILATFIVVKNLQAFSGLAYMLAGTVLAYIIGKVVEHRRTND